MPAEVPQGGFARHKDTPPFYSVLDSALPFHTIGFRHKASGTLLWLKDRPQREPESKSRGSKRETESKSKGRSKLVFVYPCRHAGLRSVPKVRERKDGRCCSDPAGAPHPRPLDTTEKLSFLARRTMTRGEGVF